MRTFVMAMVLEGGWIEPKPQIDAPAELVNVIVHNIGW